MAQYWVTIHRLDDYDPRVAEDEAMSREIDTLNEQMQQAGVIVFVGGLQAASYAKSLRMQANGEVLSSDGPYLGGGEHVGGFWVLDVTSLNEALSWGRKAAIACRASVEVRPFH